MDTLSSTDQDYCSGACRGWAILASQPGHNASPGARGRTNRSASRPARHYRIRPVSRPRELHNRLRDRKPHTETAQFVVKREIAHWSRSRRDPTPESLLTLIRTPCSSSWPHRIASSRLSVRDRLHGFNSVHHQVEPTAQPANSLQAPQARQLAATVAAELVVRAPRTSE